MEIIDLTEKIYPSIQSYDVRNIYWFVAMHGKQKLLKVGRGRCSVLRAENYAKHHGIIVDSKIRQVAFPNIMNIQFIETRCHNRLRDEGYLNYTTKDSNPRELFFNENYQIDIDNVTKILLDEMERASVEIADVVQNITPEHSLNAAFLKDLTSEHKKASRHEFMKYFFISHRNNLVRVEDYDDYRLQVFYNEKVAKELEKFSIDYLCGLYPFRVGDGFQSFCDEKQIKGGGYLYRHFLVPAPACAHSVSEDCISCSFLVANLKNKELSEHMPQLGRSNLALYKSVYEWIGLELPWQEDN
ncbi:hypothetical protein Q4567_06365 [Aliiglaciecola sp. 2_MG-2023]|uniref:hypothetical protein n=1 Tax=unclassified Aliiglaciecola TaxID=2593648 RepID=UPI0026E2325C|nr:MULTISPECIES: hypothetical protein [unclassified Aliiglaciecola]MDO6710334.1 hypothetical protein [Aliiglaciecola sp. 2_MG-2023]MDO6751481.1 hypothetical protein [Aliiglaciecola sp. 1_MG-2023]